MRLLMHPEPSERGIGKVQKLMCLLERVHELPDWVTNGNWTVDTPTAVI
jgi:hypothetical protein